jgi:hypothetical protein
VVAAQGGRDRDRVDAPPVEGRERRGGAVGQAAVAGTDVEHPEACGSVEAGDVLGEEVQLDHRVDEVPGHRPAVQVHRGDAERTVLVQRVDEVGPAVLGHVVPGQPPGVVGDPPLPDEEVVGAVGGEVEPPALALRAPVGVGRGRVAPVAALEVPDLRVCEVGNRAQASTEPSTAPPELPAGGSECVQARRSRPAGDRRCHVEGTGEPASTFRSRPRSPTRWVSARARRPPRASG